MTDVLANVLSSEVLLSESASQLDDQVESSISGQSDRVWPWQYFRTVENKRS
jgi:thioredoxin-related protein